MMDANPAAEGSMSGNEALLGRAAAGMAAAAEMHPALQCLFQIGGPWLDASSLQIVILPASGDKMLVWRWPAESAATLTDPQADPQSKWNRLLHAQGPQPLLDGPQGADGFALPLSVEGQPFAILLAHPRSAKQADFLQRLRLLGAIAAANLWRLRDRALPGGTGAAGLAENKAADLRAARRIQTGLNSAIIPAQRQVKDFSVQVFQRQSADIGGDSYFYQPYPSGRLLAGVADASGKGVSGALGLARFMTLVKQHFGSEPESVESHLHEINEALRKDAQRTMATVSLCLLLFDAPAGSVSVWCFAAPKPRAFSLNHKWETLTCPSSPPLGFRRLDMKPAAQLPLEPYRHWLLVSDGIEEAHDAAGRAFADARLLDALDGQTVDPLGALVSAWEKHLAPGFVADDATALLLTHKLPGLGQTVSVTCTPETIYRLRETARWWLADFNASQEAMNRAELALDEILTNLWKHAYHGSPGSISLTAEARSGWLEFVLRHQGDGIADGSAAVRFSLQPRKEGGRGLRLIFDLVPDISFSKEGDTYIVRLPISLRGN
jgi:anti-sigma regulatory factor (Ser/Thr protein kinase)